MKKIIIAVIAIISVLEANAQYVHFSQFWNNTTQLNPAMNGLIPANLRVSTFYRSQWNSVSSPYKTYGFNLDTRIDTDGSAAFGLGVNLYRDVAGDSKLGTTRAQIAFSTILDVADNSKISIGLNGGMIQRGFDANNGSWNSQYNNGTYDPMMSSGESFNSISEIKGDMSAGIAYMFSTTEGYMTANDEFNMTVGVSFNHILRPKFDWFASSPDELYSNIVAHGEFLIGVPNSKWSIKPAFLAQFQGPSKELLIGSQFRLKLKDASRVTGFVKGAYLSFGTFMRLGDAFIPSVVLEFDKYSIGTSYDLNISELRTASGGNGGFELSFKFRTPNPYLWRGRRTRSRSSFR